MNRDFTSLTHFLVHLSFLSNLPMTQNQVLQTLHDSFAKIELLKFASMFECEVNVVTRTFRAIVREQFRNKVGL